MTTLLVLRIILSSHPSSTSSFLHWWLRPDLLHSATLTQPLQQARYSPVHSILDPNHFRQRTHLRTHTLSFFYWRLEQYFVFRCVHMWHIRLTASFLLYFVSRKATPPLNVGLFLRNLICEYPKQTWMISFPLLFIIKFEGCVSHSHVRHKFTFVFCSALKILHVGEDISSRGFFFFFSGFFGGGFPPFFFFFLAGSGGGLSS